jgi:hypothetical protein
VLSTGDVVEEEARGREMVGLELVSFRSGVFGRLEVGLSAVHDGDKGNATEYRCHEREIDQ